jgi:hypothetical protein
VNSLKQGTESLKKMNEILKLEDIEQLMEDSREAVEYQNVGTIFSFIFISNFLLGSFKSSSWYFKSS